MEETWYRKIIDDAYHAKYGRAIESTWLNECVNWTNEKALAELKNEYSDMLKEILSQGDRRDQFHVKFPGMLVKNLIQTEQRPKYNQCMACGAPNVIYVCTVCELNGHGMTTKPPTVRESRSAIKEEQVEEEFLF